MKLVKYLSAIIIGAIAFSIIRFGIVATMKSMPLLKNILFTLVSVSSYISLLIYLNRNKILGIVLWIICVILNVIYRFYFSQPILSSLFVWILFLLSVLVISDEIVNSIKKSNRG